MKDRKFAIAFLNAIEKKHESYFVPRRLSIMQCVEIEGTDIACVRVIKDDLPPNICYDIEIMFWRTDLPGYTVKNTRLSAVLF
ncbi:MAG: hypothetical protein JWR02_1055 [Mucilaginibacter sp.]|nr:hypothetical protein [Mucilaginibacter sp.]